MARRKAEPKTSPATSPKQHIEPLGAIPPDESEPKDKAVLQPIEGFVRKLDERFKEEFRIEE